ncbi:MAG: OmpH family outer membrane protein [Rhodocyclaceae bacterium]|nr:OmpH family outer membrane protein [Rhodocyclaceae bacterium]MBX3669416.1 OmpH family outer membrane protein [Rhodocyclaceae bacterium]
MRLVTLVLGLVLVVPQVLAGDFRVGFVDSQRVLREAAPAQRALKKLQKEFEKREQELQRLSKQLQTSQETFEKNAVTMADSERRAKERELADTNRDFQRKKREYSEDLSVRQNEEMAQIIDRANRVIKQIAESEKYDLIVQDAVYWSSNIDITDKVIKNLADQPEKK